MLSKKAKYGLKAMAILAQEYGHGPLLIGAIAERERIPMKFLEHILLELKHAYDPDNLFGVGRSIDGSRRRHCLSSPDGDHRRSNIGGDETHRRRHQRPSR